MTKLNLSVIMWSINKKRRKYKSNQDIKEFYNKLDFTHGKYNTKDVFVDLVTLETYFIYVTLLKQSEKAKEFDELMKKYTLNEQKYMWQMLLELSELYKKQDKPYDILGEIFNNLNMVNVKSGQFFTPQSISKAIASINTIDEKEIQKQGYISLHEPACGTGGMILVFAKELQEKGYDTYRNLFVQCWDIDKNCAMMTFLQLSFYDIPAQVIWGNTLTLKPNEIFYTPAYFVFEQLRKEGKLTVPLCSLCQTEILGEVYKSELTPNTKLCKNCYKSEQRLLLLQKFMKSH